MRREHSSSEDLTTLVIAKRQREIDIEEGRINPYAAVVKAEDEGIINCWHLKNTGAIVIFHKIFVGKANSPNPEQTTSGGVWSGAEHHCLHFFLFY